MRVMFRAAFLILLIAPMCLAAQVCPRFTPGSAVTPQEDLFSKDGVLTVSLTYQTTVDQFGNTLFCFTDGNGAESPTLHVNPGDRIAMSVTNQMPSAQAQMAMTMPAGHMTADRTPLNQNCGSQVPMSPSSVNVHFHGTNTPPICHQDEVIHTLINPGETFDYSLDIPSDEPPGLYWYHPHVHGISEPAVQGGASGAIIVEGIQNVNPAVAGLTQQLLIVRDNNVPGSPTPIPAPSWDVSLNYTPIPYPAFTPAVITMKPDEQQFWRVLNASADTILDLQVQYDGKAQNLTVVAMDGVPVASQDGATQGQSFTATDILLPPGVAVRVHRHRTRHHRGRRDAADAEYRYRSGRGFRSAAFSGNHSDQSPRGRNRARDPAGFRTASSGAFPEPGTGHSHSDAQPLLRRDPAQSDRPR